MRVSAAPWGGDRKPQSRDRHQFQHAPSDHRRRPRIRRLSGQGVSRGLVTSPIWPATARKVSALADNGDYDVLVIDRMLPKRDGLSVIGTLREKGNRTPALILSRRSARSTTASRACAPGGDDYLRKPYSFAELLARVEVLSRRQRRACGRDCLPPVGDLELDRALAPRHQRQGRADLAAARVPACWNI